MKGFFPDEMLIAAYLFVHERSYAFSNSELGSETTISTTIASPPRLPDGSTPDISNVPPQMRNSMHDYLSGVLTETELQSALLSIAGGIHLLEHTTYTGISNAIYERTRRQIWDAWGYRNTRGQRHYWPPTAQTLMRRLGDGYWSKAIEKAGAKTSLGRRRIGLRFTENDYHNAVIEFRHLYVRQNLRPTFSAFCEHVQKLKISGRRIPSGMSVRNYFGSWNAAMDFAEKHSEG